MDENHLESLIARLRAAEAVLIQCKQPSLVPDLAALVRKAEFESAGIVPSQDPREIQAGILWAKGFGKGRYFSFEEYLASIPEIPEPLMRRDDRFPLLVLVEPRPGLQAILECVRLTCEADPRKMSLRLGDWSTRPLDTPYWMRCNNGRERHRDQEYLRSFYASLDPTELALTLEEGACLYGQHPKIIKDFDLILAATEYSAGRTHVATINSDRRVRTTWEGASHSSGFATRLR